MMMVRLTSWSRMVDEEFGPFRRVRIDGTEILGLKPLSEGVGQWHTVAIRNTNASNADYIIKWYLPHRNFDGFDSAQVIPWEPPTEPTQRPPKRQRIILQPPGE